MTKRFHFQQASRLALGIPRWMGENPFFGFLILLFFALLISSAVFYRYVFMLRNADVQNEVVQTPLDQQMFQRVIGLWQERDQKFNAAGNTPARNIFAPPQKPAEELTP